MEVATPIVVALLVAIAGTIAANVIWTKMNNFVRVKRIRSVEDKDVNQIIDLYVELFPNDFNAEELVENLHIGLLKAHERVVPVEDIWLAAKYRGRVVGFLFCHYYPKRKKALVSYYGIDKPKELPNNAISGKIIKKMLSYLRYQQCEYIFYDLLRPDKNLPDKEKIQRKARIKLFKGTAKLNKVTAYELKFDYIPPKISLTAAEQPELSLIVIPLRGTLKSPLSRSAVNKFLDFIYKDCYGDVYGKKDPRFKDYRKELMQRLEEVKSKTPESVRLE